MSLFHPRFSLMCSKWEASSFVLMDIYGNCTLGTMRIQKLLAWRLDGHVLFALLMSHTIFRIAVNNTNMNALNFQLNPLKPYDPYRGRTAPLTSKRCILYIYSTNIRTEYFKHGIYSPFFPLQNAVCFIILTCLVPVLFTFYIQVC